MAGRLFDLDGAVDDRLDQHEVKGRDDEPGKEPGDHGCFHRCLDVRRRVSLAAVAGSMTGKAGGVPRVVHEFVDQVGLECGRALDQREKMSLVDREHIRDDDGQTAQTGEPPALAQGRTVHLDHVDPPNAPIIVRRGW
jgi:hypothetical protein